MQSYPKFLTLFAALSLAAATAFATEPMQSTVDNVIKPLMAKHDVPGLSVAIVHDGKRHVFHYGIASRETGKPVDDDTLFEIGSLSKPFTGTLVGRLQAEGLIDISTTAQSVLPELKGTPIGGASLLQLLTYTAGGLPLQFPDGVDTTNFVDFYRRFKPTGAVGAARLYSNPSIGLSGYLASTKVGEPFSSLLEEKVFRPLKLANTFLDVSGDRQTDYAQGYSRDNVAVRVNPGLFDQEAYGVKTTASDLLRFVEATMNPEGLDKDLGAALLAARTGVYSVGHMHQGLGWELYRAPARSSELLQGADPEFVLKSNAIEDRLGSDEAVGTVSKTGSTGGFGAYALFQPERGTAIVILANRFWSNPARIEAAHAILGKIDRGFVSE